MNPLSEAVLCAVSSVVIITCSVRGAACASLNLSFFFFLQISCSHFFISLFNQHTFIKHVVCAQLCDLIGNDMVCVPQRGILDVLTRAQEVSELLEHGESREGGLPGGGGFSQGEQKQKDEAHLKSRWFCRICR